MTLHNLANWCLFCEILEHVNPFVICRFTDFPLKNPPNWWRDSFWPYQPRGCLLIKLWRMIWQILCNPSTFMEAYVCVRERASTLRQRENCWTCEWEILRKNLIVILWDVGKDEKSLVHNSAATLRWCVTATPAQNLQLGSSILAMVLFQIWILTPSHEKGKERESF